MVAPKPRSKKVLIEEHANSISRDTLDDLRRELEGKINLLNPDIKEKLPAKQFYWFFGILALVLSPIIGAVFGYAVHEIGLINGQINGQDGINSRMAVVNDRVNELDNRQNIKH